VRYSLLVEEYIIKILKGVKLKGSLASVGSFSRRELSPFSDIDVMFIFEKVKGNEEAIQECVTKLWDGGIEVSHTVREFSDLKRFLKVFEEPRKILKQIQGIAFKEMKDADVCCGAAGTFCISQSEISKAISSEKAQNIIATGADIVCTSCAGCKIGLSQGLIEKNSTIPVYHPVELLAELYLKDEK